MKKYLLTLLSGLFCFSTSVLAAQTSSTLYLATDDGTGAKIGTVTFTDTDDGLQVSYALKGLPVGEHGFHVHEYADCSPITNEDGHVGHAMAAGGHYDPENTGQHLGPFKDGHRGDLPVLVINDTGNTVGSFTFGKDKKLKAEEFKNRSIMIHEGGDNYSDTPAPLGGGGARLACGIIK